MSKIGIDALNPLNDVWLMSSGSDRTPDYMAWAYYRNSDWHFPLGLFAGYSFPETVSIGLTGAIPLLAVPAKMLSGVLPEVFQYFGLWLLLCYILQAVFSYKLLENLGLRNEWLLALSSCMLVISYTFLDRIAHMNLCAHWQILAGLCLYFSSDSKSSWWKHGLLVFASVWTHPYLIVFTISIAFADFFKHGLVNLQSWLRVGLNMLLMIVVIVIAWLLIGNHIMDSEQAKAEGFGVFSANLNTFFTAKTEGGILPPLPRYHETQFEGVAYLGLGVLVSMLFFPFLWYKNLLKIPKWNMRFLPILILAIAMFIFSLSNQITLNDQLIWHYQLPPSLMEIASILRGSGRYVWLIHYLLLSGILVLISTSRIKNTYKYIWLFAMLLVTVIDFWPQIKPDTYISEPRQIIKGFQAEFWEDVIAMSDKFIMYPPHTRNYKKYCDDMAFAEIAVKNKLTFNSGHLARFDLALRKKYRQGLKDTLSNYPQFLDSTTIVTSGKYLEDFHNLINLGSHEILEANEYYAFVPHNSRFLADRERTISSFTPDSVHVTTEEFGAFAQRNQGAYLLISVKNEASRKLHTCSEIISFFNDTGSRAAELAYTEAYVGIFKDGELLAEKFGNSQDNGKVTIDTLLYFDQDDGRQKKLVEIYSADVENGNEARIFVGDENLAVNYRGLNIVTLDSSGELLESTRFDTYSHCHHNSEKSELHYKIWRRK